MKFLSINCYTIYNNCYSITINFSFRSFWSINQVVAKSIYCVPQEQFIHLMSKLVKAKGKPGHLAVNRLAVVLKEERVSNKNLAEVLGYEPATVSKWSTNTIQPPLSTFFRIALTVNRDLKDFFISTKDIEGEEKKKILKQLAIVAEKGKRTGKSKK